VAQYLLTQQRDAKQVFGVSQETAARMSLLLEEVRGAERGTRIVAATAGLIIGAAGGLSASFELARAYRGSSPSHDDTTLPWTAAAAGAALIGFGTFHLLVPGDSERLPADYRAALGKERDHSRAFALVDDRLRELAARDNTVRWTYGIGGGFITLCGVALLAVSAAVPDISLQDRKLGFSVGGAITLLGGMWLVSGIFVQTPIQRLTTLWQRDPSRLQLHPSLAVGPQGASIALHGRF
jgi:hypothetical protein